MEHNNTEERADLEAGAEARESVVNSDGSAEAPDAGGGSGEVASGKHQEELRKKEKELDELKDLMKRRQADFENYKKRIIKGQEETRKFAIKDMALDILSVHDDLLRAIEASSTVKNGESLEEAHQSFVDGVVMISKMIEEVMKKYGISEIECLKSEFDPRFHEAVEIVAGDDVSVDTVTKVYQKGYMLDDLVLRSSRVRVSKPVVKEEQAPEGGETPDNGEQQ
jgi:molecular chaperone GrpE